MTENGITVGIKKRAVNGRPLKQVISMKAYFHTENSARKESLSGICTLLDSPNSRKHYQQKRRCDSFEFLVFKKMLQELKT